MAGSFSLQATSASPADADTAAYGPGDRPTCFLTQLDVRRDTGDEFGRGLGLHGLSLAAALAEFCYAGYMLPSAVEALLTAVSTTLRDGTWCALRQLDSAP